MIRPERLAEVEISNTTWSTTAKRILERAVGLAQGDAQVSVEERHLWRSILMETRGVVFQALDELGMIEAIASRLEGI
jgi:hypothetical protein